MVTWLCHLFLCSIEGRNPCQTPQARALGPNQIACDGRQRHTGHRVKMYRVHLMVSNNMLKIFFFLSSVVDQLALGARRSQLLSGACTWGALSPSSGLLHAIDWRSNEFRVAVPQRGMTADFNTTWHYIWLLTFSPHPPPCSSSSMFFFFYRREWTDWINHTNDQHSGNINNKKCNLESFCMQCHILYTC